MKLIKTILPMFGISATALCTISTMVSCTEQRPLLSSLIWDENDGDFVYNTDIEKTLPAPEKEISPEAATQLYFDAVNGNKDIFTNDLVQMCFDFEHSFAFDCHHELLRQRIMSNDIASTVSEDFWPAHIEAKLWQWDPETLRVSFSLSVKWKCSNDLYPVTGSYEFEMENCPMKMFPDNYYTNDYVENLRKEHIDSNRCWAFMPAGLQEFLNLEYTIFGEVVDPRWGGGTGAEHLTMCYYNDWTMKLNESYETPKGRLDLNLDIDSNYLAQTGIVWDSDPELFNKWRYFVSDVYWFEGFHYLDKIHCPNVY